MANFDFISDEQLRASLETDYAEVQSCSQVKAWKAVYVLVGSMIETVLLDYLLTTDFLSRTKSDPLRMDLGQLIAACEKEGVLTSKTVQLSSAIGSYRNLIHPGRGVRLGEVVDENGATVARALLQIVVNEVAVRKKEKYGYTAEQIVGKLERDASAMAILPHLLKEMAEFERERLLLKVIPSRYFELYGNYQEDPFQDPLAAEKQERLSECFRCALSMASEDTKKRTARNFVAVLKEEHEHKVLTYETAFFRPDDLAYLPQSEATLVREHLLARLGKEIDRQLLDAIKGLGKFLTAGEISTVVDPLIRTIVYDKHESIKSAARKYVEEDLYSAIPGELVDVFYRRLDEWIAHFQKHNQEGRAQLVRDVRAACDIPF